ncbi:transmembrane protein [Cystoisospora suis]|uniref:Transmembrane protein n=1 Tax=Cystoisospora suis TaxID=483139 RepID=A0A2C6K4K2_9APIC|nr:transmembrane protein [Cystoisospora suis]
MQGYLGESVNSGISSCKWEKNRRRKHPFSRALTLTLLVVFLARCCWMWGDLVFPFSSNRHNASKTEVFSPAKLPTFGSLEIVGTAEAFEYVTVEWLNHRLHEGLSRQHFLWVGEKPVYRRRFVNEYDMPEDTNPKEFYAYEPLLTAVSPDGHITAILSHHCPRQDRLEEENMEEEGRPVSEIKPRDYRCTVHVQVYKNAPFTFYFRWEFLLPGADMRIIGFSLQGSLKGGVPAYHITFLGWHRLEQTDTVCTCTSREPFCAQVITSSSECYKWNYNTEPGHQFKWPTNFPLCVYGSQPQCRNLICNTSCHTLNLTGGVWKCSGESGECYSPPMIPGIPQGRVGVASVELVTATGTVDLSGKFSSQKEAPRSLIALYPDNPFVNRISTDVCEDKETSARHRAFVKLDVASDAHAQLAGQTVSRVVRTCYVGELSTTAPFKLINTSLPENTCGGCEALGVWTSQACEEVYVWCVQSYGSRTPGLYIDLGRSAPGFLFLSTRDLAGYETTVGGDVRFANLRNAEVFPGAEAKTIGLRFDVIYVLDFFTPSEHFRWGPVAMSELRVVRGHARLGEKNLAEVLRKEYRIWSHQTIRRAWAPELLNVQAFKQSEKITIAFDNALEGTTSLFTYDQEQSLTVTSFDTVIGPTGANALGSRSYGNSWRRPYLFDKVKAHPGLALRLGQMVPLENEVTGGGIWTGPLFTTAEAKKPASALLMTAVLAEVCKQARFSPSTARASCLEVCHKGVTFELEVGEEQAADPECDSLGPSGQLAVFPCSGDRCSYVSFRRPQLPSGPYDAAVLTAAVDRNIVTAGPTFEGNATSSATFHFEGVADVWEILIIFERRVTQRAADLYIVFYHKDSKEAVRLKGSLGGELPVPLVEGRQRGLHEAKSGAIYRWSDMDLRGITAVSVRYRPVEGVPATVREIQIKGRSQRCPPHGFFAPADCEQMEVSVKKLTDLDCQGDWGEWSMCDHTCRRTRFFTMRREALPGGVPCVLFEKTPCSGPPFCDTRHLQKSGATSGLSEDILQPSKKRDCRIQQGEWSDCSNCRQIRYTHVLMEAALDGAPCPTERAETRFCNFACESQFEPQVSTQAPFTTRSQVRPSTRTTQTFTRTTATTAPPVLIAGLPWYYVVGLIATNVGVLLLIITLTCCLMRRRHQRLYQQLIQQAERELGAAEHEAAEAEKEAQAAVAAAAAAAVTDPGKEAAENLPPSGTTAGDGRQLPSAEEVVNTSPESLLRPLKKRRGRKSRQQQRKSDPQHFIGQLSAPRSKEDMFEPEP